MIIDFIDKASFKKYMEEIHAMILDLAKDIKKQKDLLMQLQDRIKMLEDKNGTENDK
jgi:uncharacterized coiled-coil protein SlyX